MSPSFCPCELCELIKERDATHVVREVMHVVVFPEDDEHKWAGLGLCDEHYADHLKVKHGRLLHEQGSVQ